MKLPEKCALPSKFQFRLYEHQGYTHIAEQVSPGAYKIKWARGWHNIVNAIEWTDCLDSEIQGWVDDGGWIIVDDTPEQKKQEEALPDFFLCTYDSREEPYNAEVIGDRVYVWLDGWETKASYTVENFKALIGKGGFQVLDKRPLTAEQQRSNKEYREQIATLESSIRLNEQDIEHKKRLIASYEGRKSDLLKKIVED